MQGTNSGKSRERRLQSLMPRSIIVSGKQQLQERLANSPKLQLSYGSERCSVVSRLSLIQTQPKRAIVAERSTTEGTRFSRKYKQYIVDEYQCSRPRNEMFPAEAPLPNSLFSPQQEDFRVPPRWLATPQLPILPCWNDYLRPQSAVQQHPGQPRRVRY